MQEEVNKKLPDGLSATVSATAEAVSDSGRRLQQGFASMVTYLIVVPLGPGMVSRHQSAPGAASVPSWAAPADHGSGEK
jgi:hypothetical protein